MNFFFNNNLLAKQLLRLYPERNAVHLISPFLEADWKKKEAQFLDMY